MQHITCGECKKAVLAHFQTTQTADSIQPLSLTADISRMYANMAANVVCVSLCYRTHGKGEGPMVSSPTEPAGRRQDPMGQLPFWQEYIAEMNTKNYKNQI